MQKQVRSSWTWCSSYSAPGCQTFGTPYSMASGHCGAALPTALWQTSEEGTWLCAGEPPAQYCWSLRNGAAISASHTGLTPGHIPQQDSLGNPQEVPSRASALSWTPPAPAGSSLHFILLPAEPHLLLSASFATDRLKVWGFLITNPVSKTKSENKSAQLQYSDGNDRVPEQTCQVLGLLRPLLQSMFEFWAEEGESHRCPKTAP